MRKAEADFIQLYPHSPPIESETLKIRGPTSHTTVRIDRYTAVQPHKCKDS